MKKLLCVIGTRPEVIKMAPLIHALKEEKDFTVNTLATAQHRELLDQMLNIFKLTIDVDLNIMQHNQSLLNLTTNLLEKMNDCLNHFKPDMVIGQGDTTSVFVTGLTCFYHKIPFAHLEAGLRSHNNYSPYPEEMNRILSDNLATIYFAFETQVLIPTRLV